MTSITIRDVPDEVHAELTARAASTGRSLQEFLRMQLTDLATRPDPDGLARRVLARKAHTASRLSAAQILDHRDAERR